MAVAFRQPTFRNPLPIIGRIIVTSLMTIFTGMIALGESAGRARAAAELNRQGYYKEAKAIMLGKDIEEK